MVFIKANKTSAEILPVCFVCFTRVYKHGMITRAQLMGLQSFNRLWALAGAVQSAGWLTAGLRVQPWVTELLTHELQAGLLLPSPPLPVPRPCSVTGGTSLTCSWGARELSRQQLPAQGEELAGQEVPRTEQLLWARNPE